MNGVEFDMKERKEDFKVSRKWAQEKSKLLTSRDLKILDIIRKHKLIDRNQLARLAGFVHLKQGIPILNKRLKKMYRWHFIDRGCPFIIPGQGSPCYIYALDKASAYMYDLKSWKRHIKHVKDIKGNIVKKLPINYLHNLFINDVVCATLDVCEQAGWQVIYYGIEEENIIPLTLGKASHLVPDLIIIAQNKLHDAIAMFVEVDLGNEGKRVLKSKINHYNALKVCKSWLSTNWYQEHIHAFSPYTAIFPHIVFLTGNCNNLRNLLIQRYADHYGLNITAISISKYEDWLLKRM